MAVDNAQEVGPVPLSAMVDGNRLVSSLLTEREWAVLKDDIRGKRRTISMPCGWPGMAKTSRLGTQYFAHKPGGDGCTSGESAQHLLAKAIIVEAANAAGWTAEPEVSGQGWVADVMATRGRVKVVFEVQWTRQSLADYADRQQRYAEAGIAATAWFARHTADLPQPSRALPVFGLTVTDEGESTVAVHETTVSLSEAVERLLTRRLQHRDYVADGQSGSETVEGALMDCYRCGKPFAIWNVADTRVEGRCGRRGVRPRHTPLFSQYRPETKPEVKAVADQFATAEGLRPARLFSRSTKTSGSQYMAFTCPHCNATCGDFFVADAFDPYSDQVIGHVPVALTAVRDPHWCLGNDEGLCAVPPAEVIDDLQRREDQSNRRPSPSAVDIVPRGAIGVSDVVSFFLGRR